MNELTARDTDDNGTDNYTLVYDAAGNMTDDEENYKYVWDAYGRLREVKDQSDDLVTEHCYNGLGHRIGEHVDTDSDGDVDDDDNWRYFVYDERWRVAARFGNSETNPRQEFLYQAAGLDGRGGGSYIDELIMRERDTNADGTADSRLYYCQNWRADLAALVDNNGEIFELGKFSSYGVPFGLPGADTDSDGDCDATDIAQIDDWVKTSQYMVIADVDLDGDTDATDESTAQSRLQGTTLGRGALSAVAIANRNAYAGYTWVPTNEAYFVRHRVLSPGLGRWLSRGATLFSSAGAGPPICSPPDDVDRSRRVPPRRLPPLPPWLRRLGGLPVAPPPRLPPPWPPRTPDCPLDIPDNPPAVNCRILAAVTPLPLGCQLIEVPSCRARKEQEWRAAIDDAVELISAIYEVTFDQAWTELQDAYSEYETCMDNLQPPSLCEGNYLGAKERTEEWYDDFVNEHIPEKMDQLARAANSNFVSGFLRECCQIICLRDH